MISCHWATKKPPLSSFDCIVPHSFELFDHTPAAQAPAKTQSVPPQLSVGHRSIRLPSLLLQFQKQPEEETTAINHLWLSLLSLVGPQSYSAFGVITNKDGSSIFRPVYHHLWQRSKDLALHYHQKKRIKSLETKLMTMCLSRPYKFKEEWIINGSIFHYVITT